MDLSILKEMVLWWYLDPHEHVFEYGIQFEFLATNDVLEYEVFLARLGLVESLEVSSLHLHNDSQLIMRQCQ
jgi:ribonuclease HI